MGKNDYIGGGIFTALGIFIWVLTFQFPVLDDGTTRDPPFSPGFWAPSSSSSDLMVILSGWRAGKAEAAASSG